LKNRPPNPYGGANIFLCISALDMMRYMLKSQRFWEFDRVGSHPTKAYCENAKMTRAYSSFNHDQYMYVKQIEVPFWHGND
jgi:hypothetical protein